MGKNWREHEPLNRHTTLQIGGPARYFVAVESEAALAAAVGEADRRDLPILLLGGGSNLLIDDDGFAGLVIKNEISGLHAVEEADRVLLSAGAGMAWDELVAHTVSRGWWGLENLSAIPGTVGATPVQNVGAYGVEVGELITAVRAFDTESASFTVLDPAQCAFGYRDSAFKVPAGRRYLITNVTFALSRPPRPRLEYRDLAARFAGVEAPEQAAIRSAVIEIRGRKFPDWRQVGTAGSFFKNPVIDPAHFDQLREQHPELPGFPADGQVKVSLGWILDHVCGLRGFRSGNISLYEHQALVLINHGGATATEVTRFAADVAQHVLAATGITIEWEVTKVG